MSMHRFAGAGPIMAGLAAMVEPSAPAKADGWEPMPSLEYLPCLWHFTVASNGGVLHAVAMAKTEDEARAIIQADDPVWSKPEVQLRSSGKGHVTFAFDAKPNPTSPAKINEALRAAMQQDALRYQAQANGLFGGAGQQQQQALGSLYSGIAGQLQAVGDNLAQIMAKLAAGQTNG